MIGARLRAFQLRDLSVADPPIDSEIAPEMSVASFSQLSSRWRRRRLVFPENAHLNLVESTDKTIDLLGNKMETSSSFQKY
jgi:hypothetical protein